MIALTNELYRLRVLKWQFRSRLLFAEGLRRYSAAAAASNQMLLPKLQQKPVLGIPANNTGDIRCIIGGMHRGLNQNSTYPCHSSSRVGGHAAAVEFMDPTAIPSFDYERGSAAAEIVVSMSSSLEEACDEKSRRASAFPPLSSKLLENLSAAPSETPPLLSRKGKDGVHREINCVSRRTGAELGKWRRNSLSSSSSSAPTLYLDGKPADGAYDIKAAGVLNEKLSSSAIETKPPSAKTVQEHRKLLSRRQSLIKKFSISGSSSSEAIKSGSGGVTPAADMYGLNRRISLLMDLGYLDEAYAVYEEITRPAAGYKPDSYTYLHLMKGYCKAGKLAEAQKLFRKVIATTEEPHSDDGVKSKLILYNVMIHGLGTTGYVKEAVALLHEMTRGGCFPDNYTYNSIVHSLGKFGKAHDALAVVQSMAGMGCTPDLVTYNSIICALGKAGRVEEAYAVYELMIESGCPPDSFTFNTLLSIFGKSGQLNRAFELYNIMKLVGYQPDVYTYTSLVASLCQEGRVDEALRFSLEMTERGCPPNIATFNSWIDGLCKSSKVVDAHLLFHKMVELGYVPDHITYCILIDASCKAGGQFLDQSFNLLKELVRRSAAGSLDSRTSEIVFQSFKKVGMLKQAKRITRNARAKQSRLLTEIKLKSI